MIIKQATIENIAELVQMGISLWPHNEVDELKIELLELLDSPNNVFYLAKSESHNKYVGFIHMSKRNDYVEGSDSTPVGFIEGIYVEPDYRKNGVARAMYNTGIEWARSMGCSQIGSDIELKNDVSYEFHTKLGFKEVNRIICFIKDI